MNPGIFREYDIRGIVGEDLTGDVVESIARAFGTILVEGGAKDVAVGRDIRESSGEFAARVARGFEACGLDVIDAGVVPTPLLHYVLLTRGTGGGIMVTGSHNPIEYNGLKLSRGPSFLFGDEIQEVRRVAESGEFASGPGSMEAIDIVAEYTADLLGRFSPGRRFRVGLDTGNGVGGPIAVDILESLGHEVVGLYTEPDGTFPNHLPDPEVPEYMADLVRAVGEQELDVGLGLDGDADRLGVIDENGRKISADWLIAIFSRDLLSRHPGGKVRYDVKCSDFLAEDITAHGGVPVMGRTGHSILKREVREMDAILGGELSGHLCFGREYHLIDDPFHSALKLLELMEKSEGGTCSSLFSGIPQTFSTAEIKAPVPDDQKFRIVDELASSFSADHEVLTMDGARVVFEDGWGLVRASNTTANLTLRFESGTEEGLRRIASVFVEQLSRFDSVDISRVQAAAE